MTLLQVMAEGDAAEVRLRTDDASLIGTELATRAIVFDRWPIAPDVDVHRPPEQILAEYADRVEALNSDGRYRYIDVAALQPDDNHPDWHDTATAARSKFLAEHRHAEDEVRFFVAGRGCFYLHLEPEVLAVVCEGGDLLSVPAGTRHWFDMGARPDFVAIRFFEQEDGWIGDFTGDAIGERFPTLDQLVAA
jgi:1,2-dihydroxy-3-keto-5-methylthiopentene dioxygenase